MTAIPTYALYGEHGYDTSPDWLHWETVLSRSRLYGFRIAPHRHEQFFQILHLTGGTARVTMDNTVTDIGPPAVIAIPALPVHSYVFSENVEGVVVTLFERDVREVLAPAPEVDVCLRRPHILHGAGANLAEVGR
ncbi:MAG: AraC family ligand binding domain-containing protein, partial [Xanthobacteraceae bacterium]